MATKNIVPRANNEGGIGTSAKRWANGYFTDINASGDLSVTGTITGDVTGNVTGNVTGTASGNLPLSGGTMTGDLKGNRSGNHFKLSNQNSDYGLALYGYNGSENNGATVYLVGKDALSNAGYFQIKASDGTNKPALEGRPDGTLTWGGATVDVSDDSTKIATTAYVKDCVPKSVGGTQRPVYTNSNGVVSACTATGSAGGLEGVASKGDNYIRWESGVQMCWGGAEAAQSGVSQTYPVAFSSNPKIYGTPNGYGNTPGKINITTTKFTLTSSKSDGAWVDWLAIGYWK